VGIAPEHIHRIFDPYFTTKPRGPERGSGLGLSIVYSIVKKHGGFVAVESNVEVETAFSIYLPVSMTRVEPSQRRSCEPNRSLERILVMDDEDIVREVIGKQLAHLGYQAVLVRDGAEALLAYQEAMEAGEPFAGVIMDLTIPGGMGGRETIPRLIALDPHARAILSSGYSNDPIMQDYSAYEFCGMVAKPYKIHELREVLQVGLKEGD
jgi:two-component system, cell cycle sensor histidine kinase and response regulator CckA